MFWAPRMARVTSPDMLLERYLAIRKLLQQKQMIVWMCSCPENSVYRRAIDILNEILPEAREMYLNVLRGEECRSSLSLMSSQKVLILNLTRVSIAPHEWLAIAGGWRVRIVIFSELCPKERAKYGVIRIAEPVRRDDVENPARNV
ncbi:hypothetical protein Pyrfu_0590 [Pyrolobus fumarii 1A]|uniref:Uncharacterized protein n=2 Tax=Pyrolobus fumarii TaxID=54252 RepID=G0EH10_PYRF1|nr:hypothetical protein Pyrfu_0590 [Pyrolobus fumarii 1A]